MLLSVVLATFNEEENIAGCLESVQNLAGEIIVVDGGSADKTVEIAKKYNAKVIITDNPPIFHINKQKAVEMATGEWILQLDADEVISDKLANEIKTKTRLSGDERSEDSRINKSGFWTSQNDDNQVVGYYLKRKNYFLGKWLHKGGQYPDPVIRLFQRGKGKFPCQSVHEQIAIDGKVETLKNDLLHYTAPTLARYLANNDRYAILTAKEFKDNNLPVNILTAVNYLFVKPIYTFFLLYFRHKGILDGYQGFLFAFFSGLLFAKAYIKYLKT